MAATSAGKRRRGPPGNADTGSAANVSSLAVIAGDRFGQDLSREGRDGDALAGIAGGGIDARPHAADIGQALKRDRQRAAPGIGERGLGKRGIDAGEVLAHQRSDIAAMMVAIGLAAAENQAAVGRWPEVVDDEAGVGDRLAAGNDTARLSGADRFGGDDVVVDRHHPRVDLAVDAGEIAVAGEDDDLGREGGRTASNPEAGLRLSAQRHRPRAFEDAGAGLCRGARQPLREFQRIEMAGAGIAPPAEIDLGADRLAERRPVEPRDLVIAVCVAERLDIGDLVGGEPLAVDSLDQARPPVAGDGVLFDQAERGGLRLFGERPQPAGRVLAEALLQPVLVAPLAGVELAAIAPRRPPADAVGFHQRHVDAGFGQMQRRRQAGVAAADDGDVGGDGLTQRREGERGIGRRGIEGRGVGGTSSCVTRFCRSCFG